MSDPLPLPPDIWAGLHPAVLSVVATRRQQGRRVWDDLTSAFAAAPQGRPTPSLLPQP
jgi:hypothetical protein